MSGTPKYIVQAIEALRAERGPLAARLDAIDLAIDNLSRIYGINGTPQPLPLEPERRKTPRGTGKRVSRSNEDAQERRAVVLAALKKSTMGLTIGELKRATPKIDGKDRSNALTQLKVSGQIKRVGNTWQVAA